MGPVLVVGSTGLVGGHIARRLRADGHRVAGSSRTGESADIACDITDPGSAARAVREVGPATIVLAAGIASARAAHLDPAAAFTANTAGAYNLLEAARPLGSGTRLLLISSAAAYGPPTGGEPLRESSRSSPASIYGAGKAAAETLFLAHGRSTGQPVAVARLFNQVGPGLGPEHAPGEFALAIARAEAEESERVELRVGNPGSIRDFTDVRDTARAIARLVEERLPGVFNVCSGAGTDIAEIVAGLAVHTDLTVEIETDPGRRHHGDVDRIVGDPSKIQEATGWRPEIGLERSLRDLLDGHRP